MSSIELYHVHFQIVLLIIHCCLKKAVFVPASNRVACQLDRYCYLKPVNEVLLNILN